MAQGQDVPSRGLQEDLAGAVQPPSWVLGLEHGAQDACTVKLQVASCLGQLYVVACTVLAGCAVGAAEPLCLPVGGRSQIAVTHYAPTHVTKPWLC